VEELGVKQKQKTAVRSAKEAQNPVGNYKRKSWGTRAMLKGGKGKGSDGKMKDTDSFKSSCKGNHGNKKEGHGKP